MNQRADLMPRSRFLAFLALLSGGCLLSHAGCSHYEPCFEPSLGWTGRWDTEGKFERIVVAPDGEHVLVRVGPSGHEDDSVAYLLGKEMTRRWRKHDVYDVGIDPAGGRFTVSLAGGRIETYDLATLDRRSAFTVKESYPRFAYAGPGRLVLHAGGRRLVVVAPSGKRLSTHLLPTTPSAVKHVNSSADGSWAAVSLWVGLQRHVALVPLGQSGAACLLPDLDQAKLSPAGRHFAAAADAAARVVIGQTSSCRVTRKLDTTPLWATWPPVTLFDFTRDGLVALHGGRLSYRDLADGRLLFKERLPRRATGIAADSTGAFGVLVSRSSRPTGRCLSGSRQLAQLWRLPLEPPRRLPRGTHQVALVRQGQLAFAQWEVSAGGRIVATPFSAGISPWELPKTATRYPVRLRPLPTRRWPPAGLSGRSCLLASHPLAASLTVRIPAVSKDPKDRPVPVRARWYGETPGRMDHVLVVPEDAGVRWALLIDLAGRGARSALGPWRAPALGDIDGDGLADVAFVGSGLGSVGNQPVESTAGLAFVHVVLTGGPALWSPPRDGKLVTIAEEDEIERLLGGHIHDSSIRWRGRSGDGRYTVTAKGPRGSASWDVSYRLGRLRLGRRDKPAGGVSP